MSWSNIDMRLKAFTLLELLVGMIATGIVIAAVFSAYHIVARQTIKYQEDSRLVVELSLFYGRLSMDFDKARCVQMLTRTTFGFQPSSTISEEEQKTNDVNAILYEFGSEYVLRTQDEHSDTFFVVMKKVSAFSGTVPVSDETMCVDAIHVLLQNNETEIILKKPMDAQAEMRNEFIRIQD